MMPSPEEQKKIDDLANEVLKELRRVTVRNFWIETIRSIATTLLLGIVIAFVVWFSSCR
jgi:hypothetical protein